MSECVHLLLALDVSSGWGKHQEIALPSQEKSITSPPTCEHIFNSPGSKKHPANTLIQRLYFQTPSDTLTTTARCPLSHGAHGQIGSLPGLLCPWQIFLYRPKGTTVLTKDGCFVFTVQKASESLFIKFPPLRFAISLSGVLAALPVFNGICSPLSLQYQGKAPPLWD